MTAMNLLGVSDDDEGRGPRVFAECGCVEFHSFSCKRMAEEYEVTKSKTAPCPCGKSAAPVTGDRIYPHRPDLAAKRFFLCECGRYVGTHPNGEPLGTPADEETRKARNRAHAAFDPLWQDGHFPTRTAAYAWLARKLGVTEIHIAQSDAKRCAEIVSTVTEFMEAVR